MKPKYWVEARTAIKSGRIMSYSVWTDNDGTKREKVGEFSVTRKGGWEVALYLANALRDDLNSNTQ